MIWEDLNKKLMILHADAKTTDDVFEQLGSKFIQEGFCKDNYVEELKKGKKIIQQVWQSMDLGLRFLIPKQRMFSVKPKVS